MTGRTCIRKAVCLLLSVLMLCVCFCLATFALDTPFVTIAPDSDSAESGTVQVPVQTLEQGSSQSGETSPGRETEAGTVPGTQTAAQPSVTEPGTQAPIGSDGGHGCKSMLSGVAMPVLLLAVCAAVGKRGKPNI